MQSLRPCLDRLALPDLPPRRDNVALGQGGPLLARVRDAEQERTPMNNSTNCVCSTWARTAVNGAVDFLGHHPTCPERANHDGVAEFAAEVEKAMREWGANEDGIPADFFSVYEKARTLSRMTIASKGTP